jgi:hypothetical protein
MSAIHRLATVTALIAGCGSSSNTAVPPRIAAKADVVIAFDGRNHACVVALSSEEQGSTVPCGEVVPFVRDELRVPSGAIYDTRTISQTDKAEMARVADNLKGAGYRFIGGHADR